MKYVDKLKEQTVNFIPTSAGSKKYQLEGMWGDNYVVDLEAKTCSYRKWELCGVTCVHIVSAIAVCVDDFEAYVHECYHISTYAKVYEPVVAPISGSSLWPRTGKVPPLPSKKLRLPRRPKHARRREPDENGHSKTAKKTAKNTPKKLSKFGMGPFKWQNYGMTGHNKRTCGVGSSSGNQAANLPSNMKKCTSCSEMGHNSRSCTTNIPVPEDQLGEQQVPMAENVQI